MQLRNRHDRQNQSHRRGVIVILAAILLVVIFAFTAFTVDIGYMNMVDGELQNAADAAALAATADLAIGQPTARATANAVATTNRAANRDVKLDASDIIFGRFDFLKKTFVPTTQSPNATKVIARVKDQSFYFAPVFGARKFSMGAEAIAMVNPRDIVFVVDLSGSMNDDTEPVWATDTIAGQYGPQGFPRIASQLMSDVFQDFGFGGFPGTSQHLGAPLGVTSDDLSYAQLTKDNGPLTTTRINTRYRILNTDDELTRRRKCYSWIIDSQIAPLMPAARPAPSSTSAASYAYWEKYLDYLISPVTIGDAPPAPPPSRGGGGSTGGGSGGGGGSTSPPPPSPPTGNFTAAGAQFVAGDALHEFTISRRRDALMPEFPDSRPETRSIAFFRNDPGLPRRDSYERVSLPPNQDGDRITGFNNPNRQNYPMANGNLPSQWRNKVGYFTYVQYMMDWGRDRSPDVDNGQNATPGVGTRTQLSLVSGMCPLHDEDTPAGRFRFPPREQPMHATRRALIAAIDVVARQNQGLSESAGDRVAIITFDALDAQHQPQIVSSLNDDFRGAMQACTTLQSVSDLGASTAIEAGLLLARAHLEPPDKGGQGRSFAHRVVVLLTDGVPNVWASSPADMERYIENNPSGDYYGSLYPWYNSALIQAARMNVEETKLYNVGVGLGCDYDFMDRMARRAGTDVGGRSTRGSGNPAEYEQRMIDIFTDIIRSPGSRLVK